MALTDILPSSVANPINTAAQSPWNPVSMVTSGRNYLDTLANNWLVKPASANGIGGFVFDVAAESQAAADTDITDHYTEFNEAFQDHAALRPLEITMRGFVGEKVMTAPQGVAGLLSGLQNKLTQLPALLGKYTPGAVSKISAVVTKGQNLVNQVDNIIGRAQNIVGLIANGSPAPTKQEQAFGKLMSLRDTRQVFTLVSPWGIVAFFDPIRRKGGPRSFVIRRIVFEQSDETKDMSDIVVTLKEVRFATVTSAGSGQTKQEAAQNNSGVAAQRMQGPTNKGQESGIPAPFSAVSGAFA